MSLQPNGTTVLQEQVADFLPRLRWEFADKNPNALKALKERVQTAIDARTPIPYSDWVMDVTLDSSTDDEGNQRQVLSGRVDSAGVEFLQYIALQSFADRGTLDSAVVSDRHASSTSKGPAVTPVLEDIVEVLGLLDNPTRAQSQFFWGQEFKFIYGDFSASERRSIRTAAVDSKNKESFTPVGEQLQNYFKREEKLDDLLQQLEKVDRLAGALYENYGKPPKERLEGQDINEKSASGSEPEGAFVPSKSARLLAEQGFLLRTEVFRVVSSLADEEYITTTRLIDEIESLGVLVWSTSLVVSAIETSAVVRLPSSSTRQPALVSPHLSVSAQFKDHATGLINCVASYTRAIALTDFLYDTEIGEGRLQLKDSRDQKKLKKFKKQLAHLEKESIESRHIIQQQKELIDHLLQTRYPDEDQYDVPFFQSRVGGSAQNIRERMIAYEKTHPGRPAFKQDDPAHKNKWFTDSKKHAKHFEDWLKGTGRNSRGKSRIDEDFRKAEEGRSM